MRGPPLVRVFAGMLRRIKSTKLMKCGSWKLSGSELIWLTNVAVFAAICSLVGQPDATSARLRTEYLDLIGSTGIWRVSTPSGATCCTSLTWRPRPSIAAPESTPPWVKLLRLVYGPRLARVPEDTRSGG